MANSIQLTPAEIAEYENAAGQSAPAALSPIRDFSADELFDLAIKDKDHFDLVGEFRRNKELWQDPATVQKVADVHSRIKDRGFELSDLPGPGKVARTVFDIAKGFGKQAWNYANALVGIPIASAIGEITGAAGQPGFTTELAQEGQRRVMENIAGTEAAAFGVARLGEKAIGKVRRAFVDQTPEEKLSDLWKDVGSGETEEEILKGRGGLLEPLGGEVRKELEAAGKLIRPEETSQLAAGDPLSFYTFGKIFKGVGRGIRAGAVKVAERLPVKAVTAAEKIPVITEKAAEQVGGRTIQTVGNLTNLGGRAVKIAAPAVGLIKGAIEAGPLGALAGLKGGEIAAKIGGKISKGGRALAEAGKEISGEAPVTGGVTQLAKDVIGGVPVAATEIGKGLAFDIGTSALTAEAPRDTESIGIGAFFGGLGAARRVGSRIISGQLVSPRAWGSDKLTPSSGKLPTLDAMHAEAIKNATPAVKTRLNAIRQFLKGSHTDSDIFLAKDASTIERALINAGISPGQARRFSKTEGFFVTDITDFQGNPRRVIIARNVDAAPHESFHAIQDVLGETANQAIDQIVREEYGPRWEQEGQRYASRIGEGNWREVILDSTGTGLDYAKEKIAMDVANEYRAATGAEPPSGFVQDRAKAIFGQVMDRAVQANPNIKPNDIAQYAWRDILSPQEATAVADSYLARELAAENFDMVFKNAGPALQQAPGLTGRLARIVAQLISTLGGEPLSPERPSQIGRLAPRFRVTEAVREAPSLVEPRQAIPIQRPTITFPATPAQPAQLAQPTAQAEEARIIAEGAPETPTVTGTASPREILGSVAEAIAQQAGLKINYLSAPGEPAGAITSNREARRTIIEAFRTMPPEARALWEKNFFPDRVVKLKGDKYQILGWAPEVFAANAHKLAAKLQELGVADASPYPIKESTFTPEGWQELFQDTQTFVQNQISGRTGAGEPLVVPREITERGFFAPPVRGQVQTLPQLKADFISMLFGIKLPATPRIQKGRFPLNIAGQVVSEATLAGRTETPVIPRGRFEGAEAERQGIAGREIMEVNPLRQQIEAAAQAGGVAMPEFIEAQQRLNLENIKNVEVAPELPQFRGNVLTLSAGFQPRDVSVVLQKEKPEPSGNIYRTILAKKGTKTVGRLDYLFPSKTDTAELLGIEVDEDFQRQGIGSALLEKFKADAKNRGIRKAGALTISPEGYEVLKKVFDAPITDKIVEDWFDPEATFQTREVVFQFQPSSEPRAIKSAAVKDERGKVWEGFWHGDAEQNARVAGATGPFKDGFTTNVGEFLDREAAFVRAKKLGQIESDEPSGLSMTDIEPRLISEQIGRLETSQLPKDVRDTAVDAAAVKFQPEQQAKDIAAMTAEEFRTWAEALPKQGKRGFTEVAHDVGLEAPSREFVDTLSIAQKAFGSKAEEAMKAGDFEKAMALASQSQFFREAWEAATGEGSAGFFFREQDPNFQPKFPLDRTAETSETAAVKFQPKEYKLKPAKQGFSKAWIFPNGKPVQLGGQWHHEFLNENNALRKQYDIPKSEGDANRTAALQKGFARINYAVNTGRLTVEAREADWPKLKQSVHDFVDANADKIDWIEVHLMDHPVEDVLHTQNAKVFELDDNEKAAMTPFLDIGEAPKMTAASERLFGKAVSKAQMQPRSVKDVAEEYAKTAGIKYKPSTERSNVPEATAKKIADFYDTAAHSPEDAEVQKSYDALAKETMAQYKAMKDAGYEIEPWTGEGEPYKSSADMIKDVTENKHLYFLRTKGNFEGQQDNAMLQPAGESDLLVNDVFRAVHDFFGHAKEGLQFGPKGEFNAWKVHSEMYSPEAQGALAAETLAQNFWVNFGKQIRRPDGSIPQKGDKDFVPLPERQFAEQKNIVIPDKLLIEVRAQFQPKRADKDLFGFEEKMTPREISKLPRADLLEIYPEAIVPKDPFEPVPSKIVESPMYKQAGSEEAAVKAFGDKLAEFARSKKNDPVVKAGAEWYDKFTPMLQKEFGKDAQLFAELLAATSPNTGIESNFKFALDALDSFKSGRFEKVIAKFNQGLEMIAEDRWKPWYNKELKNIPNPPQKPTAATFLEHWIAKHDLKPRQTNGKLYGIHSLPVLQVFARRWLTDARGPKTLNFIENLMGQSHEATIDIWADRTMRRIGYEGQERWRVLPKNVTPVSDKDFTFSQKAFRHAAEQLGIKPIALQGMLWFAEKQLWADNGWTELDLGDFQKEMKKIPVLRAKRKFLTPAKESGKIEQRKLL